MRMGSAGSGSRPDLGTTRGVQMSPIRGDAAAARETRSELKLARGNQPAFGVRAGGVAALVKGDNTHGL
jgi:hypothetical protein